MRSALGWKTVDRGASGANRSRVTVNQSTALHNASLIDRKVAALPEAKRTALLSQVASDIERKKQVLSGSSVHRGLTSALTSALARTTKAKAKEGGQHVLDVVCLGLGSLYDGSVSGKTATVVSRGSINARFQLAALLLLVDSLGQQSATADSRDAAAAAIDDDAGWGVRLVAYDPMFNAVDRLVLAETKCTVLRANMEGRHPARQDAAATLFYMPHCGRLLYNNAVYANWGSGLRRMFIIGNSIVDAKTNAHHTQVSKYVCVHVWVACFFIMHMSPFLFSPSGVSVVCVYRRVGLRQGREHQRAVCVRRRVPGCRRVQRLALHLLRVRR
jgi:hypothetical protein